MVVRKEKLSGQMRRALIAVLRRRCPDCGIGKAFDGWWKMREGCDVCGRQFQQHPGSTTGVMQIGSLVITLFGFASFGGLYLITGKMDRSILGMAILTTLFGLIFHPFAKLLWEAGDVIMDRMESDEDDPQQL
jgi:uncharacterized protein (DUF983 family)